MGKPEISKGDLLETAMIACFLGVILASLSGCGVVSLPSPTQDGHILIAGDAKGMRAFGDTMNGLVSEGKTSPDIRGAYWQHREMTENQETQRHMKPSFLSGLFGGGAK